MNTYSFRKHLFFKNKNRLENIFGDINFVYFDEIIWIFLILEFFQTKR